MFTNDSLSAQLWASLFSVKSEELNLTPDDHMFIGFGNFEMDAGAAKHKFLKQLNTSVPKLPGTKDKRSLLLDRLGIFLKEINTNENLHQKEPHPH